MKSRDGLPVDADLQTFLDQEAKERRQKEKQKQLDRKRRQEDEEWRSAWKALAGKNDYDPLPWPADGPVRVQKLASLQSEPERERVRRIRQRTGNWLRHEERHKMRAPLEWRVPADGKTAKENFTGCITGVFKVAAILEQAYESDGKPKIDDNIDHADLRSDNWLNLWNEIFQDDSRPVEPVPFVQIGHCGEGHEWTFDGEPVFPIRCPVCEEIRAERKRSAISGFVYQLGFAAGESTFTYADEPDVRDTTTTLDDQLVFWAAKQKLCDANAEPATAAKLVIRWIVSTSEVPRSTVVALPVVDAVAMLKGASDPPMGDESRDTIATRPDHELIEDGRVLVWGGERYRLTKNMFPIIQVLYRAFLKGRPEVSLDTIRQAAESASLDESLQKAFVRAKDGKKFTDPVWQLIESVGQEVYRLRPPIQESP